MKGWLSIVLAVTCAALLPVRYLFAGELTLDKEWVHKHMNRVTVAVDDFVIVYPKDRPDCRPNCAIAVANPISSSAKDGDTHLAGFSSATGLLTTGEIINSAGQPAARRKVMDWQRSKISLKAVGVWRIWFEHALPSEEQKPDKKFKFSPGNSGANHVFELHPLLELSDGTTDFDLSSTVERVPGYQSAQAKVAFARYEAGNLDDLEADQTTIHFSSTNTGFNYSDFIIEIADEPVAVEDGTFVLAKVRDLNGKPIPAMIDKDGEDKLRRMAFVKDSAAESLVTAASVGARFQVMGIPRVNLERLVHRMLNPDEFAGTKPTLPYEMVIIAAKKKSP